MTRLPVLLSIPHGGRERPPELDGRTCITDRDLFDDSDPFANEIYNTGDKVQRVIYADIPRTFVDLNRSPQDMPPTNPDGLIKSKTAYNIQIYRDGQEPDDNLCKILTSVYYYPYHQRIQNSTKELDLRLCLDCHTMAAFAPNIAPDKIDTKRPTLCLSNADGKSAPNEMMNDLADCMSESFRIDRRDVSTNDPFHGGYITKTYGNDPIPWIQVEMSRSLYLDERWFDPDRLVVKESRLGELNKMFGRALELFFKA